MDEMDTPELTDNTYRDVDAQLGEIAIRIDKEHVHLSIGERTWKWMTKDSDVMIKGHWPEWPPEKRDGDNDEESEGRRCGARQLVEGITT